MRPCAAHSARTADVHSPHHHGSGVLGLLRGAWHAHVGWFFDRDPEELDRYVSDLRKSAALRMASALFLGWVALGLVIPAVLGGVVSLSWAGVWTGLTVFIGLRLAGTLLRVAGDRWLAAPVTVTG